MDVTLQEHPPIEALRPHVQYFWTGRFSPGGAPLLTQRVVPSGFVEIIFHLTPHRCDLPVAAAWRRSPVCTLLGLQREPYEVRFTGEVEVFAGCLRASGFYALFGTPVREVAGSHEDLVAVLGPRFQTLADRLMDEPDVAGRLRVAQRFLCEAARDRRLDAPYLLHAEHLVRASGGALRVADLADRLSVSPRQLERAFQQTLGVSPKQLLRIVRLNRALGSLQAGRPRSLAEVAYQAGYADQAHFARDFKQFVGAPASLYLAEPDPYALNALDVRAGAAADL